MTKTTPTFWHQLRTGREVGLLLTVVGVLGCIQLLRSERSRPLTIGFVLFSVALVAPLARYTFQPLRNVLPVLPLLCVGAAAGIAAAADALGRSARLGRWPRTGLAGAATLVLCLLLITSGWPDYHSTRIHITNSRIQTVDWLAHRVGPGDRVLIGDELGFLPSELARIPAHVTTRPLAANQGPFGVAATEQAMRVLARSPAGNFKYVVVADALSAKAWRPILQSRKVAVQYGAAIRPSFLHQTVASRPPTDPRTFHSPQDLVRVFSG